MRRIRAFALLLLAGCAAHAPDEADTSSSPLRTACGGEVRQVQASCNPGLLRPQGSECSAAVSHVSDHCGQAQ